MRLQLINVVTSWAVITSCQNLPVVQNVWSRDVDYIALSNELSSSAMIYYPGSEEFEEASARWSNLDKPTPNIVVVPSTENDVVEIVKFANKKNLHFLAYNSAHGGITSLGRMKYGIEIYLNQLSSVSIAEDGKTVTIAGGTKSKLVTDTLWNAGKQTVTAACECVSYLGPALGGGHDWLQGRHGLVADQFQSMNIVLANGSLVILDSSSDLWWAVKGAGHNFGIVTSVTSKIYDVEYTAWANEILTFSGDKVEELYDATNKYILKDGTQVTDVINWSYWTYLPDIDPSNPVIQILMFQEGVETVDSEYTAPFRALAPISVDTNTGVYTDLAKWAQITVTDVPCQLTGANHPRFPLYLETFDAAAQRRAFDVFADGVRGSSPFNTSIVKFDDYSMEGVKSVDAGSTAFAYRMHNILVGTTISYMPGDAEQDVRAAQLGEEIRRILLEGTGREHLAAYVNYAFGNEGPEAWYGSESWRQDRLRSLKLKYDPNGVFSYYGPVLD